MLTWILTTFSLLGSYLNARKVRACFTVWIACNTGWMLFDIYNGVYSRAVLDIVQTAFCVYGLYEWRDK